jgi:hypothetical protein
MWEMIRTDQPMFELTLPEPAPSESQSSDEPEEDSANSVVLPSSNFTSSVNFANNTSVRPLNSFGYQFNREITATQTEEIFEPLFDYSLPAAETGC